MKKLKLLILALLVATMPMSAAVRASSVATFFGNNVTIPLPTGTVAGDTVMIWVWQGFSATTPADWANLVFQPGGITTFNGITATRVMSATDISNGSVVVSAGGTYYGTAAALTFIGAPGFREYWWYVDINATPKNITTTSSPLAGDTAIYFSACRSTGTAPTVDRGVLQHNAADGTAANGSIYVETLTGAGAVSANFSFNGPVNCVAQVFIMAPTGGGASQVGVGSSQ